MNTVKGHLPGSYDRESAPDGLDRLRAKAFGPRAARGNGTA
jgi:hypothetical protein